MQREITQMKLTTSRQQCFEITSKKAQPVARRFEVTSKLLFTSEYDEGTWKTKLKLKREITINIFLLRTARAEHLNNKTHSNVEVSLFFWALTRNAHFQQLARNETVG